MSQRVHEIVYKKWLPDKNSELHSTDTYRVGSWTVTVLIRAENQVDAVTDLREICREEGFEIEIQEVTYIGKLLEKASKSNGDK